MGPCTWGTANHITGEKLSKLISETQDVEVFSVCFLTDLRGKLVSTVKLNHNFLAISEPNSKFHAHIYYVSKYF